MFGKSTFKTTRRCSIRSKHFGGLRSGFRALNAAPKRLRKLSRTELISQAFSHHIILHPVHRDASFSAFGAGKPPPGWQREAHPRPGPAMAAVRETVDAWVGDVSAGDQPLTPGSTVDSESDIVN